MNDLARIPPHPFRPQPLRIGLVTVEPPLVLAPMAGVTERSFRRIMAEHGAGLVTSEMVSAEGIIRKNRISLGMLSPDPAIRVPVAIQLFGSRPEAMAEAAMMIEQSGAALIDINAGCPVRKVARQGAGAVLLRQPEALQRVVEAVKQRVHVPVTVKLRLGWDDTSINVLETARRMVDAGVDAITLHARTARQGYAGQADWSWIQRLKHAVPIPVIGNGDVTNPHLAQRLLEGSGCDGVMIGRASLGNPWLFTACAAQWGYPVGSANAFTWTSFHEILRDHVEGLRQDRPNRSPGAFRKVIGWYLEGCPGAGRLRHQLNGLSSPQAMMELCQRAVDDWAARGIPFLATRIQRRVAFKHKEFGSA